MGYLSTDVMKKLLGDTPPNANNANVAQDSGRIANYRKPIAGGGQGDYYDYTSGAGSGYGGDGIGIGRLAIGENLSRDTNTNTLFDSYMKNLSRGLLQNYNRISTQGAYAGAIPKIQGQMTAARNLRTAAIRDALRRKLGRRLGPRSGAVDMALINSIYPQALADEQGTLADLLFKNEQSKLGGLDSAQDLLKMVASYKSGTNQIEAQQDANKFGWGDALGLVADIGAGIATGGASMAVKGVAGAVKGVAGAANGGFNSGGDISGEYWR